MDSLYLWFRCLGKLQQIKDVHGKGFELFCKSKLPSPTEIKQFLEHSLKLAPEQHVSLSEIEMLYKDECSRPLTHGAAAGMSALNFAEFWLQRLNSEKLTAWVMKRFPGARKVEGVGSFHRFLLDEVAGKYLYVFTFYGFMQLEWTAKKLFT